MRITDSYRSLPLSLPASSRHDRSGETASDVTAEERRQLLGRQNRMSRPGSGETATYSERAQLMQPERPPAYSRFA